ncbi:MAG: FAD-dependent oxidoreductase [Myxococcaceae bacterium]|jgi:ferredoxin-NADP reductase|nr:FAD-dependent oxidoreductase [Myxococcaceae bacterium]
MSSAAPARPLVPETFTARLVEARLLGPRVRHLVFARADEKPFEFEAGQWVQLILPLADEKGRALRRSYSIASAPNGSSRFELAVTKVDGGPGSTWLHGLEPGTSVEVKGPAGTFTRALDTAAPSLFIATGTGVAPFRGMIHDALAKGRTEPLWLLFGVRTPDEYLFRDELEALATKHPCLRLEPSLSRPPPGWTGRTGYVQTHVKALWSELTASHPGARAYICGVKKMLTAAREVLRVELGVDRKQVHLEAYD